MGLKFYVGEAQARSSQAAQLNGQAGQAIASLQSSIQLFLSAPLSSKAYDSAKSYFMVAYTPLCQSAIMTGEALESAHKKFLSDYQGSVSGIDTDEDLILEEINRFEDLKRDLDQQMSTAKTPRPDLERRYMNACDVITQRREKLAKFHAYNGRSASIFSEYQACQQEFNAGLAQVKECKAWNPASGTFDLGRLNMSWAKPITTRWKQREKMRQEKLKNGSTGKANTLADHGLTEADLVQVSDPPELVYQKYIKFAALGLNPHTGKPLTDKEKWQFQYAAHAGTMSDLIGLVGGAYAGQRASNSGFYKNLKRITPKYDDINFYEFNGFDNPGPLSKFRGQPQRNFYGGRYNFEELSKPKILYRGGDSTNPFGQWFTETPPKSVAEVRINTAVKPQWIDNNGVLTGKSTIDTVYALEFPAGTKIYKGPVGNQGGIYQGGLNTEQIYINKPWELGDSVKIIDSKPLK